MMTKYYFLVFLLTIIGVSATTVPAGYYSVTSDLRRCASPLCGGYFVQPLTPVNPTGIINEPASLYVTGFNFSISPNITDTTPILSAVPSDLVLFGFIGPQTGHFNLSQFFVISAYRALPPFVSLFPRTSKRTHNHGSGGIGIAKGKKGKVKPVKHNKHGIRHGRPIISASSIPLVEENYFLLSQCPNTLANCYNSDPLTSQQQGPFTNFTLDLAPFVDQAWVDHITVSGSISLGYPQNSILIIDKTFVQLPQPTCRPPALPPCPFPSSPAFRRDDNRCLSTVGCVREQVCPLLVPACSRGYSLVSFPSLDANGCPQYFCDPSFLPLYSYPPSN